LVAPAPPPRSDYVPGWLSDLDGLRLDVLGADGFIGSHVTRLATNAGARVQRLLWASTSTKDPHLADTLYVEGLAAPHTINTMPESTLLALDDHGRVGEPMRADAGDALATLAQFEAAGIDLDALAGTLQSDGAQKFTEAWNGLMTRIVDQVALVRV
jgi:transaldolase